MIDSIAFTLKSDQFQLTKTNLPRFRNFGPIGYSLHQTKEGTPKFLRVELSAPKFLLGNNFDELEEKQFPELLEKILKFLKENNIETSLGFLRPAGVSLVHYSKNIIFRNYHTPGTILSELNNVDLGKRYGPVQTHFENSGHCLKFRTNSFELVFYDKIEDLKKAGSSSKYCEEKETKKLDLTLLDRLQELGPFEVLRMEVRFNTKTKIKQVLKADGITSELTFEKLFSKQISQKILLSFWNDVENNYYSIKCPSGKYIDLFEELVLGKNKLKIAKALKTIGLQVIIAEEDVRRVRKIMDIAKPNTWNRLKPEWKKLTLPNPTLAMFKTIKETLTDFTPLNLVDIAKSYPKD